jgi:hypothetical protein
VRLVAVFFAITAKLAHDVPRVSADGVHRDGHRHSDLLGGEQSDDVAQDEALSGREAV